MTKPVNADIEQGADACNGEIDGSFPSTETIDRDRRQFLGLIGTAAAASAGIAAPASADERPGVAAGNNYFDPVGLYVEPGTTVQFEIKAGTHSITAYDDRIPNGVTPFDSSVISGGTFEYTFETPGTYDYYCIPHQSTMVGQIVVGEPGGPAENSPIPDGEVPESEEIVEQGAITIDEFDDAERDTGGHMMGSGMTDGNSSGWMMLMPIGFMTGMGGLIAGVVYWVTRKATPATRDEDSAMTALREQYARGEIDNEEFERRHDQLQKK